MKEASLSSALSNPTKMKFLLATLLATALADYTTKDDVVILTDKNFKKEVLESDELWMVEFYAPWCGHCKSLEPAWKKAAKDMKGQVKFGAVDATVHQSLGSKYGVRGYPTIKVFGKDKKKPTDYNGGRSASDLVGAALGALKKLKGGAPEPKDKGAKKDEPKKAKKEKAPPADHGYGSDVVVLTDTNFDKTVKNNKQVVFVKFMAPWCGHCKAIVGDISDAATKLKGDAVVGVVDATAYGSLASRYDVKGYPTLVAFFPDGSNAKYTGERSASSIVAYVNSKVAEFGAPPEVPQITSADVFEECKETTKSACIIAFLPHVADGGAARRNKLLDLVKDLAGKNRRYNFMWTAAGEQSKLANALSVSVFPALVAVNFKKGKFGAYTAAFDAQHLNAHFKRPLSANAKMATTDVVIADVAEWDGKDYVPPAEEE